ncbi:ferric reductase-like transmembrane domain-containing protein [Aureimonas sp. Leaf454]|uniref:ferric reductase-like transmembrane domain-containing protein n=1 Tax=Aureimonas sp. Leaf454 TaxID=1736381 RepID=UPI000A7F7842|nr:ferric reductase-like transmembrane domain-containing protein [Aureimonas sp. Leaf454]
MAAASPLQGSRDVVWVVGGMAGVVALSLLFLQPILITGFLSPRRLTQERRWHRWIGSAIVVLVLLHVVGLYVTSPEDIMDALLLVSPTPFAVYGVMGLAGVVLTAGLAIVRRSLPLWIWQSVHTVLAGVIVAGSIVHALLIEGVMEETSKLLLCVSLGAATSVALLITARKAWTARKTLEASASRIR